MKLTTQKRCKICKKFYRNEAEVENVSDFKDSVFCSKCEKNPKAAKSRKARKIFFMYVLFFILFVIFINGIFYLFVTHFDKISLLINKQ